MNEKFLQLEDLETWKKSRELRINFSRLVKTLPPDEKYKLIDQMTRAARSITNNISEG